MNILKGVQLLFSVVGTVSRNASRRPTMLEHAQQLSQIVQPNRVVHETIEFAVFSPTKDYKKTDTAKRRGAVWCSGSCVWRVIK